jgi:hypothetical protein
MDEKVKCPRCHGKGDVEIAGKTTKCYACGGRGEIEARDVALVTQWREPSALPAPTTSTSSATRGARKPAAPKRERAKTTKVAAPIEPVASARPPLVVEAADGYLNRVRALLEEGTDANVQDADGRTALHWAALRGYLEIAQLLLEHGAEVNATDAAGRTPLKMATISNRAILIKLLTARGGHV